MFKFLKNVTKTNDDPSSKAKPIQFQFEPMVTTTGVIFDQLFNYQEEANDETRTLIREFDGRLNMIQILNQNDEKCYHIIDKSVPLIKDILSNDLAKINEQLRGSVTTLHRYSSDKNQKDKQTREYLQKKEDEFNNLKVQYLNEKITPEHKKTETEYEKNCDELKQMYDERKIELFKFLGLEQEETRENVIIETNESQDVNQTTEI